MSQRKFKVKVIQISLKNNKLAKAGDVVSESELQRNAAELVKGKFIVEVGNSDAKAKEEAKAKEAFAIAFEEGSLDANQLDSITKDEIKIYADSHQIVYDDKATKAVLIKEVLEAKKSE